MIEKVQEKADCVNSNKDSKEKEEKEKIKTFKVRKN